MRYHPLTKKDKKDILQKCNVNKFEDLITNIPDELKLDQPLDIDSSICEQQLVEHLTLLANKNTGAEMACFIGQGVYHHTWPTIIDQIVNRGEFLTAYTPYQPEISQGTLQLIFEFQSLICELFSMPVSNASLYDGSTALMEAILMALRIKKKKTGTVLVSPGIYNSTIEVLRSYLLPKGIKIKLLTEEEFITVEELEHQEKEDIAAVVITSPNKWGLCESWKTLKAIAESNNAISIAHITNPISMASLKPPGEYQIDIVTGEGQALGIPMGFGGPYLGLMCTQEKYLRQMPGRIVGQTTDSNNRKVYCVTLATREQHIRRDKATSNICSNQNLMMIRAGMYLTLMGPKGLKKVNQLCHNRACYFEYKINEILSEHKQTEIKILPKSFFNEVTIFFNIKNQLNFENFYQTCIKNNILIGQIKQSSNSLFPKGISLAFTERHSIKQLNQILSIFKSTILE